MSVLNEILSWSQYRPAWQRDALRRLIQDGELALDDIQSLVQICKSEHGLSDPQECIPLSSDHLPYRPAADAAVSLISIFHHRGVNALAQTQTLTFGPELTLVYGDNAAGKTGYIRILKAACRARGQEEILGNVVLSAKPLKPVVSIKYKVGANSHPQEWAWHSHSKTVSRVSVFDAQCAAVYLNEKTDVAFRPFGLDLFDKLVGACKAVREHLEKERNALPSDTLSSLKAQVPEGTAVSTMLANISLLTKPESVRELSELSQEEESRLDLLRKLLVDFRANDPLKQAQHLAIRAGRVRGISRHVRAVDNALCADAVSTAYNARVHYRRLRQKAKKLWETTLSAATLNGTGTESWNELWESARQFSEEFAYLGRSFPVVENGAECVLCQQYLDHDARQRLLQFEAFVASTVQQELGQAKETFEQLRTTYKELKVTDDSVSETLEEIRIEHKDLSDDVISALETSEHRRKNVVHALYEDRHIDADFPSLVPIADELDLLARQIEERVSTLQTNATNEKRELISLEVRELSARKLLADHEQVVLDEIDRKRRYAAYALCIDDTKTHMITRKSTEVTRKSVTQKIKQSFQDELSNLAFRHMEVELKEVGGVEGVLYHRLVLTRAPGVELPKVVSEGEQRCLSIASFFAELSTAADPSGIVFDDPVSSLDYKWREAVARRLVEEAKTRQVIVFTHDIVFLLLLKQFAAHEEVHQHDQHIRQLSEGAGVCTEELPWVALKVNKRIGHLRRQHQDAEKLHRDGHQFAYEKEASLIYGYLREAWERGLEEVLLAGVVERFRPSVQTQQIATVADITLEDCRTVEAAMTKCSQWLTGHDQAPAARADIPTADTVKADIEEFADWVNAIRRRRK